MRTVNSSILSAIQSGEIRLFVLLAFTANSNDHFYTDCDVPIMFGGDRYEPRPFSLVEANYGSSSLVDNVTFEISDVDNVLSADFLGGTVQGEALTMSYVVLDSSYDVIGSDNVIIFDGEVSSWNKLEDMISITAAGLFERWSQQTFELHSASCRWRTFKGTRCGYSGGGTSCDRSYSQCQGYSNTANFGGFRWLPSITDATLWWGQK